MQVISARPSSLFAIPMRNTCLFSGEDLGRAASFTYSSVLWASVTAFDLLLFSFRVVFSEDF